MHLTVKALDPFSPFISLPANIKHAAEEIRHWVRLRHNNSIAAAPSVKDGTELGDDC